MSDTVPQFELSVTRIIRATPEHVYKIWAERLTEWWCPKPWTSEIVENDMRPGGRMAITMRGPDGEHVPNEGVYLEVIPNRSIIFTDAFRCGWIPQKPFMLGFFRLEAEGGGTRYTAGARHWDAAAMEQHAEMGFETGWSAVAAQLASLAES